MASRGSPHSPCRLIRGQPPTQIAHYRHRRKYLYSDPIYPCLHPWQCANSWLMILPRCDQCQGARRSRASRRRSRNHPCS
jgi:hypothetical protein